MALLKTKFDYQRLFNDIADKRYSKKEVKAIYRDLMRNDLYFLIRYGLDFNFLNSQFHYDRCIEVQKDDQKTIDLWARYHGKSTIVTVGRTIFDLLNHPDRTVGIFSHTSKLANSFVRQISHIFRENDFLRSIFPDIIPPANSNRLKEDRVDLLGCTRKEGSVSGTGLVDGQPIGMHYDYRVYDDIVVPESVGTSDQIEKLEYFFRLSHSLKSQLNYVRVIGTRYHYSDLFDMLLKDQSYIRRIFPAIINNRPILLSQEELDEALSDMGTYIYNCQMLLDPQPKDNKIFNKKDLQFYDVPPMDKLSKIMILVDPAISKKKNACYFVAIVVASTPDHKIYVLDYNSDIGVLPKTQTEIIYEYKVKYPKAVIGIEIVGYQEALKYSVEDKFMDEGLGIPNIVELKPKGSSKDERIKGLQPYVENNQLFLRPSMTRLIDEIHSYPFYKYKDHIDVLAYYPRYMGVKRTKVDRSEKIINNYTRSKATKNIKRGGIRWQRQIRTF